jgi:subtilisin family serine protease
MAETTRIRHDTRPRSWLWISVEINPLRPKILACVRSARLTVWPLIVCAGLFRLAAAGAILPEGSSPPPSASRSERYTVLRLPQAAEDLTGNENLSRSAVVVKDELLVRFRNGIGRVRQQAVLAPMNGSLRFFRDIVPAGRATKAQADASANSALDQLAVVKLSPGTDLEQALNRIRKHADVLYAEPNYRLRLAATAGEPVIPNDFDFAQLWGLHNVGQADGTAGADIGMPDAWMHSTGDRRVTVAVIDTGVDYYHPDLADNVWSNPKEIPGNGLDDDGNGYIDDVHGYDFVSGDGDPMDDHGHGTHISGTIGAVGNNRIGVAGVCWTVSIMALKAFDDTGNGDVAATIEAIHYAIQNGARIINASWGENDKSRALEDVIARATAAGVLFVAAAGNDNSDALFYPAAYPHVVAVAATDAKDRRAKFSNFGSFVAVAAPGDNIYSTLPNNSYGFFSGTSMATPHVSGVAALVLSLHPEFTPDELANVLRNSVDAIVPDKYIGTGRMSAAAAARVTSPLPQVRLVLPETIHGNIDIDGSATGGEFVGYSLDYGQGANPTNWTSFFSSATPVPQGPLFQNFATPALGEGTVTFRLTAKNAAGDRAVERASVQIRNVQISFPLHNDVLRAGDQIGIRGTVYGAGRTYRLWAAPGIDPQDWSEASIVLTDGGKKEMADSVLAVWDTSQLPADQFYTLKLAATALDGSTNEFLTRLVYLDSHLKPGWPQYLPAAGTFPAEDWRHVTVADLDGDGRDEIIVVDHGNDDGQLARLLVYQADGTLLWTRDLAAGAPYTDIPVVGDMDGDGRPEIVVDVGSAHQLFAFHHDGTALTGNWPVILEAGALGKVLADLRQDGHLEVVGFSAETVTRGDQDFRQLVVYDSTGSLVQKWELPDCPSDVDVPRLFPAVGNLDQDPDLEIVAISGCGTVAAFKLGRTDPIWQADTGGTLVAPPVIGDLYQNGTNQVLIAACDPEHGNRGGVHAFSNQGKRLPGWPALVQESFRAAPALGDIDGDGRLEVCVPSSQSGLLHLLRANGFEVHGWPVGPIDNSALKSSAVLGDIDGDRLPDVVLSSPGYMSTVVNTGDLTKAGGVKAWRGSGQAISFTANTNITALVMESSGGPWLKAAPVTLADIDHDGKLDIVATSVQDRTYLPAGEKASRKNRSSLYVWQLNVPFTPDGAPWPSVQRNAQHTSYLPAPARVPQPPVVSPIPDQIIPVGATFLPIDLDQYVEDPDNSPSQISWSVTGARDLTVRIGTNRVAVISYPGPLWVGVETLRFVATDPSGLSAEAAVRLEARPGYVAPTAAPDHLQILEDTPGEIDVLANDSDPDGFPLTVPSYSRPRLGVLKKAGDGRFLYTPKLNANGVDSFSYVISNGQGGASIGSVTIEITPVDDPPIAEMDNLVLDEDNVTIIDALANDVEPDGERLSLQDFTLPAHGALTLLPDKTFRYVPNTNYFGLDEFTCTIADEHGNTNSALVQLIVRPLNDPPVADAQKLSVNKNASLNITFTATDPDDTDLTYKVVDSPQHGTLWTYPAVAVYYPTNGFSGLDSFTYRANDGKDDGPLATVNIAVLDANNPPELDDMSIVTKVGQLAVIHITATDLDDDPLTFEVVRNPAHGSLSGEGTNYLYQPNPGFQGADEFAIRAFDGRDYSRVARINVTLTDQNTAPSAQDFAVRTLVNTPTNITLRATDPESNPLNYHVVTRPKNGKITGKGAVLLYSPNASFAGSDRFQFKVDDGELSSAPATVTIAVDPPNHAPNTATNQQTVVLKNTPAPIALAVSDPDGDTLNCPILKGPKNGRLSGLGTNFVYTPKADFVGTDTFTYKAWDGQTYSKQATVNVTVTASLPVEPPEFTSIERQEDGSVRLLISGPQGTALRVEVSSDMVQWDALPAAASIANPLSFIDQEASKYPVRFYRASYDRP